MCRKINKDDKKEMKQIEDIWLKRSIEVHRFVDPNYEQFWKDGLLKFRKEIKIEECEGYVYEKDREVKGFITWENRKDHIYIYELFVSESGKGYGTKLLNKVKELNKSKGLVLNVYMLNIKTVNWYLDRDFVIYSIRECPDEELNDFNCEKERLKYKMQRRKYTMVNP